jgi:hypothetical protein
LLELEVHRTGGIKEAGYKMRTTKRKDGTMSMTWKLNCMA